LKILFAETFLAFIPPSAVTGPVAQIISGMLIDNDYYLLKILKMF
jgi:hypothetical protein